MIILVSDLHLVDNIGRSTFDAIPFFDRLSNIVESARKRGVTDITLILLGDIFEVLKSEWWLTAEVRPWESCTESHVDTVDTILKAIIESNSMFFERLRTLIKDQNLRVEYVPGNHDWPLNTDMGIKARARLRDTRILTSANGGKFKTQFEDPEHRLFAIHGHDWDPSNRYGDKTVAIGDAIVIEMVLQLPILVGKRLNVSINRRENEGLGFLDEMDNIRPHTLPVIAQWLNGGLALVENSFPNAFKETDKVFERIVERIIALQRTVPFETFAVNRTRLKALSLLAPALFRKPGFLKMARFFPSGEEGPGTFRDRARREFLRLGEDYQYIVCGHTHAPMIVPIDLSDGSPARLYINTGTWRRTRPVARSARQKGKQAAFACWDEECVVSIFTPDEQQRCSLPTFDFHRLTRGN
ncbi:MAG TPA: hypothetical protein VJU86_21690 [Pyrinomonadaceae bacterium]|nr:hypothetical protein [Pyrinomonadaceae bacterium]